MNIGKECQNLCQLIESSALSGAEGRVDGLLNNLWLMDLTDAELTAAHFLCLSLADYAWAWRFLDRLLVRQSFASYYQTSKQGFRHLHNLRAKTILTIGHQGYGDFFQMLRYYPILKQWGAIDHFLCDPSLNSLLIQQDYADYVMNMQEFHECQFSYAINAINMLPILFNHGQAHLLPKQTPYITSRGALNYTLQARIQACPHRMRVLIYWSGDGLYLTERNMDFRDIMPLLNLPICFIIGQKTVKQHEEPLINLPNVIDARPFLTDWAATAQLTAYCTMTLAVDGALANLSAAMGKETWVLLHSKPADWRFALLNGRAGDWYTNTCIFRQTTAQDWRTPIAEVTQALMAKLQKYQP